MDLKLDTTTGDLAIEMGGLVLVDGIDAIAQDIRCRLRFFKGEWFIDERIGMPHYQSILVKNPNLGVLRSIFQKAILQAPGVEKVDKLELTLSADRALRVSFQASTVEGPLSFDKELIL